MMRSLFAGVSALRYHQVRMDVIGNNIANVNTIGYKASRVTFKDLLSQTLRDASAPQDGRGGTNPVQIGLGITLGNIATYHTQGNPQSTGIATDLAIEGDGFFILANGPERFYTRAGMFDIDSDGNLVSLTTGLKVMGWMADDQGRIDVNAPITELVIPRTATIDPRATTQIVYTGNLDSRDNGSLTLPQPSLELDDGAGNVALVTFKLTPTGSYNEFQWEAVVNGGTVTSGATTGTFRLNADGTAIVEPPGAAPTFVVDVNGTTFTVSAPAVGTALGSLFSSQSDLGPGPSIGAVYSGPALRTTTIEVYDSLGRTRSIVTVMNKIDDNRWEWEAFDESGNSVGSGELIFNSQGRFVSQTGGNIQIAGGLGGSLPLTISPDFSGLTQFGEPATAVASSQDGYGAGILKSFGIDSNGVIIGSFSNGLDRQLGQIAVATFANPAGLVKTGETMFRVSSNSGSPIVGAAGTGSRGSIASGSLEMSNVDLSHEFTDMIITQRGFQANSRVITASDEMLQELVNLKR